MPQLRSLPRQQASISPYREPGQIWAGRACLAAKSIRYLTKQMFCQNERNVTLHFLFLSRVLFISSVIKIQKQASVESYRQRQEVGRPAGVQTFHLRGQVILKP